MKKKKTFIVLAVTLALSILLFTGCKKDHSRGAFALDYVTEVLDLTAVQEEKLDSIREELLAKAELMHKDKEQMHSTLKEQLAGEAIDKEVIRQLVADHRANMDSIIELAIDRIVDFHSDLTPEQRTKLVSKLEKFEKYHGHHFNR